MLQKALNQVLQKNIDKNMSAKSNLKDQTKNGNPDSGEDDQELNDKEKLNLEERENYGQTYNKQCHKRTFVF